MASIVVRNINKDSLILCGCDWTSRTHRALYPLLCLYVALATAGCDGDDGGLEQLSDITTPTERSDGATSDTATDNGDIVVQDIETIADDTSADALDVELSDGGTTDAATLDTSRSDATIDVQIEDTSLEDTILEDAAADSLSPDVPPNEAADADDAECTGLDSESTPCASDVECNDGFFCDHWASPPTCTAQNPVFWTEHKLPSEVVDGERVVFYVSSSLGDDTTGDGSQEAPFRTINRANLAVRGVAGAYTGPYGAAEHAARGAIGAELGGVPTLHGAILLRRGDSFHIDDEHDYLIQAGLGGLPGTKSGRALLALEVGGVSAEERFILSTYGPDGPSDYSLPRPKLFISRNAIYESGPKAGQQVACQAIVIDVTGYGNGQAAEEFCPAGVLEDCLEEIAFIRHVTVAGIEIAPGEPTPGPFPIYHRDHLSPALIAIVLREGVAEDFLFEDLYIHHVFGGIFTSGSYGLDTYDFGNKLTDIRVRHSDLRYRRCVFAETYAGLAGQSTASAIAGRHADNVLLDECIFDQVSWSSSVNPVTASDSTLFPDKVAFHTLDADTVPLYSDQKFGTNWGAFSPAAPHLTRFTSAMRVEAISGREAVLF